MLGNTVDHILYNHAVGASSSFTDLVYVRLNPIHMKYDVVAKHMIHKQYINETVLISDVHIIENTGGLHDIVTISVVSGHETNAYNTIDKDKIIANVISVGPVTGFIAKDLSYVYFKLDRSIDYVGFLSGLVCVNRYSVDSTQLMCLLNSYMSMYPLNSPGQYAVKIHQSLYIEDISSLATASNVSCDLVVTHCNDGVASAQIVAVYDVQSVQGNANNDFSKIFVHGEYLYIFNLSMLDKRVIYTDPTLPAMKDLFKVTLTPGYYHSIVVSTSCLNMRHNYAGSFKICESGVLPYTIVHSRSFLPNLLQYAIVTTSHQYQQNYQGIYYTMNNLIFWETSDGMTVVVDTGNIGYDEHESIYIELQSVLSLSKLYKRIDAVTDIATDLKSRYGGSHSIICSVSMSCISDKNATLRSITKTGDVTWLKDRVCIVPVVGNMIQLWVVTNTSERFIECSTDPYIGMVDGYLIHNGPIEYKELISIMCHEGFVTMCMNLVTTTRDIATATKSTIMIDPTLDSRPIGTNEIELRFAIKKDKAVGHELFESFDSVPMLYGVNIYKESPKSKSSYRETTRSVEEKCLYSESKIFAGCVKYCVSAETLIRDSSIKDELKLMARSLSRAILRKTIQYHGFDMMVSCVVDVSTYPTDYVISNDVKSLLNMDNASDADVELEVELYPNANLQHLCSLVRSLLYYYTARTYDHEVLHNATSISREVINGTVELKHVAIKYIESIDPNPTSNLKKHVMPITLDKETFNSLDEAYVCSPKYDGVRYYLVYCDGCLYKYDRKHNVQYVGDISVDPRSYENITKSGNKGFVLDTEEVNDTFYVFDCMVFDGIDIRDLPYQDRLKYVDMALSYRISNLKQKIVLPLTFDNFKALADSSVDVHHNRKVGRRSLQAPLGIDNVQSDGIILYRRDQTFDEQPIKWKKSNTVDLLDDGSSLMYLRNGEYVKLNTASVDRSAISMYRRMHGGKGSSSCIVECVLTLPSGDESLGWNVEVVKVRTDKDKPNDMKGLDYACRIAKEGSRGEMSYESVTFTNHTYLRRAHNAYKHNLLGKISAAMNKSGNERVHGVVLDIGSGHGQDIARWEAYSDDITHLYLVEPNVDEYETLHHLIKNPNSKRPLSIASMSTLLNFRMEESLLLDSLDKTIDFVTMFFVIEQSGLEAAYKLITGLIKKGLITSSTKFIFTFFDYEGVMDNFYDVDNGCPKSIPGTHITYNLSNSMNNRQPEIMISSNAYNITINDTETVVDIVGTRYANSSGEHKEKTIRRSDVVETLQSIGFAKNNIHTNRIRVFDQSKKHERFTSSRRKVEYMKYYIYPEYVRALSRSYTTIIATGYYPSDVRQSTNDVNRRSNRLTVSSFVSTLSNSSRPGSDILYEHIDMVDRYDESYRSSVSGVGQHIPGLKSLLSECRFITEYYRTHDNNRSNKSVALVYAGASPGHHIPSLVRLFPKLEKIDLYDPDRAIKRLHDTTLANDGRITVYNDELTLDECDNIRNKYNGYDVLFISDIKSSDTISHISTDTTPYDYSIDDDMQLQRKMMTVMRPTMSLLRFKLPYGHQFSSSTDVMTYSYPKGLLLYCIYAPSDTFESKLIVDCSRGIEMTQYNYEVYMKSLFNYNTRKRPQADHQCESHVKHMYLELPHGLRADSATFQEIQNSFHGVIR